jgi:hypothetical protein
LTKTDRIDAHPARTLPLAAAWLLNNGGHDAKNQRR